MSHFSLKISQDNSFLRGFLFKKYVIFSLGFNLFKEEYNLCKEKNISLARNKYYIYGDWVHLFE